MAEDFKNGNWWNNPRSGGFDGGGQSTASPSSSSLSCSTTTTDVGAAAFSWSSATEISESKPVTLFENHVSGLGFSTLSADWNQTLPGKAEISFHSMLQRHALSTTPFSVQEVGDSSSAIPFRDMNSCSSSSSPSYAYSSSPSMLQGLIEPDSRFQQPFSDSQRMADYQSQMMSYHGVPNEVQQPSWSKPTQLFESFSQNQQSAINQLQYTSNYTSFWNASPGLYPSPPPPPSRTPQFESRSSSSITAKSMGGDWQKRISREPGLKKARIETHSPMPAFKVRKEKLGDRITALQQLVSPFGKTDTASVLHEAIDYIKFLHDQISVLCTPYFKTGRPMHKKQTSDKCIKPKDGEESRQDLLRSRGLCLVPIASIHPVANENNTSTSDFWTPTYGRANY